MVQALLIDLDGVLRIWKRENYIRAEQSFGLPSGAISRIAFSPELLTPAITGQVTDEYWREQIAKQLQIHFPKVDTAKAVSIWSAPAGEIDYAVLEVVRTCRQKLKVILVTNATSRLAQDLEKLQLSQEFDYIINSSVVGVIKPQPEIFIAALQTANLTASETFFVDDSAVHVNAAIHLGINGHIYQNIDQFKDVLGDRGLL